MRFAGKTIVVTGAASGIGRETALRFAREGGIVYGADINDAGLTTLAQETDGKVIPVHCDVTETEDLRALMERAAADMGGIDVLVNNAGAPGSGAPLAQIDPVKWDRAMNLLLRSAAFGMRYAVEHMRGRPGASIVNTASIAALVPGYSSIDYCVAKAGVVQLTKVAAAELAPDGIRVNAVLPGLINTNIFVDAFGVSDEQAAAMLQALKTLSATTQPVRRPGVPADIAEAVLYLASEAGGFVNGMPLVVDGGVTIGPRHAWDPTTPGPFADFHFA